MTVQELRVNMMKSKKTDMKRSLILSLVLDQAQKIAKTDGNREPTEKDVENAASKLMKLAEQSKAAGMNVDRDITVFQEFVPQQLDDQDLGILIDKLIFETVEADFPKIMKQLKGQPVDMKKAVGMVKEKLK